MNVSTKSITITEHFKNVINEFLGTELIPACAVGNELVFTDGNLILKTFSEGGLQGYRKLACSGELINIIVEFNRG